MSIKWSGISVWGDLSFQVSNGARCSLFCDKYGGQYHCMLLKPPCLCPAIHSFLAPRTFSSTILKTHFLIFGLNITTGKGENWNCGNCTLFCLVWFLENPVTYKVWTFKNILSEWPFCPTVGQYTSILSNTVFIFPFLCQNGVLWHTILLTMQLIISYGNKFSSFIELHSWVYQKCYKWLWNFSNEIWKLLSYQPFLYHASYQYSITYIKFLYKNCTHTHNNIKIRDACKRGAQKPQTLALPLSWIQ
jgi:hypothetical protein